MNIYNRVVLVLGILALLGIAGGCQKKEEVQLEVEKESVAIVGEEERSIHFKKVASQLELGGHLFGYMDIDGDLKEYGGLLDQLLTQMASQDPQAKVLSKVSLHELFATIGMDDLKALGISSVEDEDGMYRNRLFFYMPEGRRGLFAGLGGQPGKFERLSWAGPNTDLYVESEVDLPEVYQTISKVVALYGGEEKSGKLESTLREAGREAALSVLEIIQNWKGRMVMIGRFDGEETIPFRTPKGVVVLPGFSVLMAVDGIAPALQETLDQMQIFEVTERKGLRLYELKQPSLLPNMNPVLAIEGSTLIFSNKSAYLQECLSEVGGLDLEPEFEQNLERLGGEGNGLSYFSPRLFARLHDLPELNAHLPEQSLESMRMMLLQIPKTEHAIMRVSINRPDGVLVMEYGQKTYKNIVAGLSVYNPMTIGLLSAMAIPAFQKVRQTSQEKAVMNNLRQLSAAADQYYLEYGVYETTFDALVGPERMKYIKQVQSVGGEDYRTIVFRLGEPLRVMVPSLRKEVSYGP